MKEEAMKRAFLLLFCGLLLGLAVQTVSAVAVPQMSDAQLAVNILAGDQLVAAVPVDLAVKATIETTTLSPDLLIQEINSGPVNTGQGALIGKMNDLTYMNATTPLFSPQKRPYDALAVGWKEVSPLVGGRSVLVTDMRAFIAAG